ncbi:hypothetical protein FRB94_006456 [Tulasnella sp. JGI-2019a]|nr:hypothetical protein FRB93_004096 [Tulasnella sp. JGI-2019a]KAG8999036.1 hypothetical protein FRB94_006456 [Tulasnella sp. JGI-2019a]
MRGVLAAAVLSLVTATVALPSEAPKYKHLEPRQVVTTSQLLPAYDFIIVGGGLAGLVIASRLTENSNISVLVIEAGDTGAAVQSRISTPTDAYFNGLLGSSYDWQYTTAPQVNVNNRSLAWPRGKLLGGSSAVNGMYLVRPSSIEMDNWMYLQDGAPGAAIWGWDNMFGAMKKSEAFTPPSAAIQSQGAIQFDPISHGTTGPLHQSYPGFLLDIVGDWTTTLNNMGILPTPDSNGGEGWGAFIATSSINPSNWTRSYSRSAYIDPLPPRSNLHILVNQTVTHILWTTDNGTLKATGVEYANNGYQAKPWPTVNCNKEVLLAAGAVGSPQLLMQSGVGPQDKLQAVGVPVQHALPGVGQHVQDHISTQVVFTTNAQTAATLYKSGADNPAANGSSSPVQSFINNAIAYANITDLLGDYAPTLQQEILANLTANVNSRFFNPSTDPAVAAGYKAIYNATAATMLTPIGQVELLLSLTGTSQGGASSFAVQAALQHPFSMGQMWIATSNPFDYPIIDPNYLSNQADILLLREGLKLARTIGQTAPLNGSVVTEIVPGSSVSTDDQWDAWLKTVIGTEYHPSCTCAMLPLSLGGVVDPYLKVYGTENVRVVDSSVYPIEFAAHLMAPTYGLAEQAAELILAQWYGGSGPGGYTAPAASTQAVSTNSSSSTAASSTTTVKKSGASQLYAISTSNVLAIGLIPVLSAIISLST